MQSKVDGTRTRKDIINFVVEISKHSSNLISTNVCGICERSWHDTTKCTKA